jgi:hypothetical protein
MYISFHRHATFSLGARFYAIGPILKRNHPDLLTYKEKKQYSR